MSTIRITTTQNIELEYELAGLGNRALAFLIDGILISAYVFLAIMLASMSAYLTDMQDTIAGIIVLLISIPVVFYSLLSEVFFNGQTVGKRILNIKVISLTGFQPTFGQYLLRWSFRLVDLWLTNYLCALISVGVSEKAQRVGDMVAGTTVIKTKPRTNLYQTIYTPTQDVTYNVSFPEVATLSDYDVQLLKDLLLNVMRSGNTMLAYEAAQKLKNTLNINSYLEPIPFIRVIIADYNYLTSRR